MLRDPRVDGQLTEVERLGTTQVRPCASGDGREEALDQAQVPQGAEAEPLRHAAGHCHTSLRVAAARRAHFYMGRRRSPLLLPIRIRAGGALQKHSRRQRSAWRPRSGWQQVSSRPARVRVRAATRIRIVRVEQHRPEVQQRDDRLGDGRV